MVTVPPPEALPPRRDLEKLLCGGGVRIIQETALARDIVLVLRCSESRPATCRPELRLSRETFPGISRFADSTGGAGSVTADHDFQAHCNDPAHLATEHPSIQPLRAYLQGDVHKSAELHRPVLPHHPILPTPENHIGILASA